MSENKRFRAGVLFGEEVKELLDFAKANHFALPAINCIGTNSVNATLAAARELSSPTMIQFQIFFNASFPAVSNLLGVRSGGGV